MIFHNVKAGVSWAGPWESLDNLIPLQRGCDPQGQSHLSGVPAGQQQDEGQAPSCLWPACAQSHTPSCYMAFTVTLPIFGVLFCLEVTIACKESPQIILEMSTSMSKQAPLVCPVYKLLFEGGK